jgi:hypothetical protein
MKRLVLGLILVSALCSCQEDKEVVKTTLPQQLEFVIPAGGEDCDRLPCETPMVYDGCFMFDSADTIALIRLSGITGLYEIDQDNTCYQEVIPFHSGMIQSKVSEYVHISGREIDNSHDSLFVSGLCFRDFIAWDNNPLLLVSLGGENGQEYVTRCMLVNENRSIRNPVSTNDIIDLPSNMSDLVSYLDDYYARYDMLCPPKAYDEDELQSVFDRMLECSTFSESGGRLPDPPCVSGSEEEMAACREALQE